MSKGDEEAPPLDTKLSRLLDNERTLPDLPANVLARVMARARAAVLSQPAARPQRRRPTRWHGRPRFAAAAGLLLVTAGAVAGIYNWRGTTPPATESLDPPPAVTALPITPAAVATNRPHDRPRRARATPSIPPADVSYEAEIGLLGEAQEQAAYGRFDAALAPLAEHARRFPSGRLLEEREALRVEAFSKLGRAAEACRTAEAFRRRFPRSVLSPRAGEMCRPGD